MQNVEKGLLLRHPRDRASPKKITNALRETLESCREFSKQETRRKALPPPSVRNRQLPTRRRALEAAETTLASLLTGTGEKLLISEELGDAILAGALRDASTPDEIIGAFLLRKEAEGLAAPIERALFAVKKLKSELGRTRAVADGFEPPPPEMTNENPRRAHVGRLMGIFARFRGETIL